MPADRDILAALAGVDPWGPEDSEWGSSSCHYCGCHFHSRYGEPERYVHWSTCLWMHAAAYLGLEHPTHHQYVPPPPAPVCPVCGYQPQTNDEQGGLYGPANTGTVDGHHAHLAVEAGYDSVDAWLRAASRQMWDDMVVSVVRGGITYVTPAGSAEISETESGLIIIEETKAPEEEL